MIDLTVNAEQMVLSARHCAEQNILLPTFAQMKDPAKIAASVTDELKTIGLWDTHPRNLFRISWKNEPVAKGGALAM